MRDYLQNLPALGFSPVVIDTCVLLDMEFNHRPKHERGKQLAGKLAAEKALALVPAHWFFEFLSAVLCEKKRLGTALEQGDLKHEFGFPMTLIPLDQSFLEGYLLPEMKSRVIDLKSGDMIFSLIALKHQAPLITEDLKLLNEARRNGILSYTIEEYLRRA